MHRLGRAVPGSSSESLLEGWPWGHACRVIGGHGGPEGRWPQATEPAVLCLMPCLQGKAGAACHTAAGGRVALPQCPVLVQEHCQWHVPLSPARWCPAPWHWHQGEPCSALPGLPVLAPWDWAQERCGQTPAGILSSSSFHVPRVPCEAGCEGWRPALSGGRWQWGRR